MARLKRFLSVGIAITLLDIAKGIVGNWLTEPMKERVGGLATLFNARWLPYTLFALFVAVWLAVQFLDRRKGAPIAPPSPDVNPSPVISPSLSDVPNSSGIGLRAYAQRPDVNWFKERLRETKSAWGLWYSGGEARNNGFLADTHFDRLILLSPTSPMLKAMGDMMPEKREQRELYNQIYYLAKAAKEKGTEVRYTDTVPYTLLTFGDPPFRAGLEPPSTAWVQIETYLPGVEASQRPSFFLYARDDRSLYDACYAAFSAVWGHAQQAQIGPSIAYGGF